MTAQTLRATAPTSLQFQALAIRVIVIDAAPWFAATDAWAALGILWKGAGKTGTLAPLDADGKGTHSVSTARGPQEIAIILGSGLYTLIVRSNKPEARRFRKWVRSEVLAAICKHGGYKAPPSLAATTSTEKHVQRVSGAQSLVATFGFTDIAKRAFFDRLQATLGVGRLEHIPANVFERALGILTEIEPAVRDNAKARYTAETRCIESVIRPRRSATSRSGYPRVTAI
ncbi:MAG: BRO-N domain-containing protein [Actinomycetota bacterium]